MKIEVQLGDETSITTESEVRVLVADKEIFDGQHLEVKLTSEGLIVELWDEKAQEFLPVYSATYDEMHEQTNEVNVPCKKCGRTDLPLYNDYLCPDCHKVGA